MMVDRAQPEAGQPINRTILENPLATPRAQPVVSPSTRRWETKFAEIILFTTPDALPHLQEGSKFMAGHL